MLRRTERILENIPVGSLGLICLPGCEELGEKVNDYLVKWRHESGPEYKDDVVFSGYEKDTYLINAQVPRFGSGEAKGILKESVRGKDLYLMVDVCNYNVTYSLTGRTNHVPGRSFPEPEKNDRRCWRKGPQDQCYHALPL